MLSQLVEVGSPVDAKGNPAKIQGDVVWSVSDETVLRLTPTDNPNVVTVVAVGPVGAASVTVSGDADLGEGVTTISSTLAFEIVGGQAIGFTFNVGSPREQVPPVV